MFPIVLWLEHLDFSYQTLSGENKKSKWNVCPTRESGVRLLRAAKAANKLTNYECPETFSIHQSDFDTSGRILKFNSAANFFVFKIQNLLSRPFFEVCILHSRPCR